MTFCSRLRWLIITSSEESPRQSISSRTTSRSSRYCPGQRPAQNASLQVREPQGRRRCPPWPKELPSRCRQPGARMLTDCQFTVRSQLARGVGRLGFTHVTGPGRFAVAGMPGGSLWMTLCALLFGAHSPRMAARVVTNAQSAESGRYELAVKQWCAAARPLRAIECPSFRSLTSRHNKRWRDNVCGTTLLEQPMTPRCAAATM
ncbi:hypothetical protein ABIA30_001509 [Mycobacterium sp. MAA66]